jgi:hypothetical protein
LISFVLTQGLGNVFGQNYKDLIRITADFVFRYFDTEIGFSTYDLTKFSLAYTNGSRLCPSNSCIFQFQGADFSSRNGYYGKIVVSSEMVNVEFLSLPSL